MVSATSSCFAWAFNDPAFSDVLLVLRSSEDAYDNCRESDKHQPNVGHDDLLTSRTSDSRQATLLKNGDGPSRGPVEVCIHAHSIILASCSEMLRSWLSRWSEQQLQEQYEDDECEAVCNACCPREWHGRFKRERRRRRLAPQMYLDLAPGELTAALAVIRYMYTQELEGVDSDEELLTCMVLADRWLVPDCAACCAARLQSTPASSLSWRVRSGLLALPPGLAAANHHVARLQDRTEAALLRTFRCPELAWEDSANRELLAALPAERLAQILLSREDLQVTSENVVLAMLSEWLQRNMQTQQATTDADDSAQQMHRDNSSSGEHVKEEQGPLASGRADDAAVEALPEVEEMLRLVRYGNLTAHYRTAVAPFLPGLRGLRLHQELLAEATATATAAAATEPTIAATTLSSHVLKYAASTTAAVATTPSAGATEAQSQALSPSSPLSNPCQASTTATPYTPAASSSAPTTSPICWAPSSVRCSSRGMDSRCDMSAGSVAAASGSAAGKPPLSGGGTAAGGGGNEGMCGSSISTRGSFVASMNSLDTCLGPSVGGPMSRTGSGSMAEIAAVSMREATAATTANATQTPSGALGLVSGSGSCTAAVDGQGGALRPDDSPVAAAGTLRASSDSAVVGMLAFKPSAATAVAVPRQRLPPRMPYNVLRRIDWSRDIRDVRIHLTGVGGPMRGGESVAAHQLSPAVFLGGYMWQLATRFAPAPAPGPFKLTTTSAGVSSAAGAAAASAVGSSSGRLQVQIGIVCTAPQEADKPPISMVRGPAAAGSSSHPALTLASCTLGLVDAAGRPAWNVVHAPCVLAPALMPEAQMSLEDGSWPLGGLNGDDNGAPVRWECWSALTGLEPSWWEAGGALTTGGVLRLYCTLGLQG